jgi:isochorismate hydrolase
MAEDRLQRVIFFLILSLICCNLAIYFQNESIDVLRRAVSSLERDRSERRVSEMKKYWEPEIEKNRRRMELLDKLVDEDDEFVKSTAKKVPHV